MKYPIEKGVPIPPNGAGRPLKYPLLQMEVGDSFVMDQSRRTASSTASTYGKRHGMKFTVRTIDANSTRIWRVK